MTAPIGWFDRCHIGDRLLVPGAHYLGLLLQDLRREEAARGVAFSRAWGRARGKVTPMSARVDLIQIHDALVLNLVASACRATLGPGDLAMPARLLIVAHVYSWANYTIAGRAEYALERFRLVTALNAKTAHR